MPEHDFGLVSQAEPIDAIDGGTYRRSPCVDGGGGARAERDHTTARDFARFHDRSGRPRRRCRPNDARAGARLLRRWAFRFARESQGKHRGFRETLDDSPHASAIGRKDERLAVVVVVFEDLARHVFRGDLGLGGPELAAGFGEPVGEHAQELPEELHRELVLFA